MLCDCLGDALCDRCVEDRFLQLKGVAARRGERWADVAAARGAHKVAGPLPLEPETAARLVEDITRDPRLRDRLRAELVAWAERRWSQL